MIRLATPEDANNLSALATQVWLHTYATEGIRNQISNYVLNELSAASFRKIITAGQQKVFLYETQKLLRAYVIINPFSTCPCDPSIETELDTIYVQEHFMGQGIGRLLLEEVRRWCRAEGISAFWLATYHGNLPAQAFYKKLGFRKAGSMDFQLGDEKHENLVYVKELERN